jgi:hypothetical protein
VYKNRRRSDFPGAAPGIGDTVLTATEEEASAASAAGAWRFEESSSPGRSWTGPVEETEETLATMEQQHP